MDAGSLPPPPLGSDGHCTGFPDGIGPWDWHECCLVHDAGGTDGQLLDCVAGQVPSWAEVIVIVGIGLMALFRPIYNVLQRWHVVK